MEAELVDDSQPRRKRIPTSRRIAHAARRRLALVGLASGQTIADTARGCGCGESTLRRWLESPQFRARVTAARREITEAALGRARGLMTKALAVLDDLMSSSSETTRLKAALGLLASKCSLRRDAAEELVIENLARRVDELEKERRR
jgi:transposase-like protein